ncbi:hypothetical protein T10_2881 [Trichinella papuae]|uniref:Uncharacterized protein n=1 Tax=Trichinella papuae TaxID=268474 RepID=A0A0V1M4K9_9BILA|nr:hypothetical protein T10_2881 [Trichinella papuae]
MLCSLIHSHLPLVKIHLDNIAVPNEEEMTSLTPNGAIKKLPYGDDCFLIVVTHVARKEFNFEEIRNQNGILESGLLRKEELLNSEDGKWYERPKKSKS